MLISERKLRKLIRSMIIESKRKKINENIIDDGSLEIDEFEGGYDDDEDEDDDSSGFDVDNLPDEGGDNGYGDSMPIDDEFDKDVEVDKYDEYDLNDEDYDDLDSNSQYSPDGLYFDPKRPDETKPVTGTFGESKRFLQKKKKI